MELGYLNLLALMNNAARNVHVKLFACLFISLGCVTREETLVTLFLTISETSGLFNVAAPSYIPTNSR